MTSPLTRITFTYVNNYTGDNKTNNFSFVIDLNFLQKTTFYMDTQNFLVKLS